MKNNLEILKMYESGLSIREIALDNECSYEKIRKILKEQKVKWHRNYIVDLSAEQVEKIVNQFSKENKSIKEIAKWFEISPGAISNLLKSKGFKIESNRKYDILREVPINKIQKEFIVGTVLGDGCLYRDSAKSNFKLSFGHCEEQKEYLEWKITQMSPFINGYTKSIDKRGNSVMYQARTINHKDLNMFANMFYDEKRIKHVPDNLDMYFTPLSLAILIMDDGNLNAGVNMRIATMGFTKEENEKLQDYLKRCFDINSKVMEFNYKTKKYYQITLNKKNTQKLSDIVRPHIIECMKYKIMPEPSTTTCQISQESKCDNDIV